MFRSCPARGVLLWPPEQTKMLVKAVPPVTTKILKVSVTWPNKNFLTQVMVLYG